MNNKKILEVGCGFGEYLSIMNRCNVNEYGKEYSQKAVNYCKNLGLLEQELNLYIQQEREFANKYLQKDENGMFIQEQEGIFKIIEGLEEECRMAREDLDKFTAHIELRTIPIALVENMELTPKEVGALEVIIEEE